MEKILSLTISVAVKSEVIKVKDLKKVIVDTTVMPKNIEFPTDSKLLGKARERLVKLAAKNGIALRQNYNLYQTDEARKESCVDRGYKGHGVESDPLRNHTKIFISGQRKGLTKSLKKQLKRRSAIEPMIGHMKHEGKLGLCRLKGIVGDQLNALLTGVGHNLRLILNHIRKLMRLKKFILTCPTPKIQKPQSSKINHLQG